jgi:tryptophanyl-tRNA synthetase
MAEIDPWGVTDITDYTRLFDEFGISRFTDILNEIEKPHLYMRRGIIVGHRGYEDVLRAMKEQTPFAVMSGFMPSGKVHLGGKMVMDEIIWHQRMGGDAFACVADMESHSVRSVPLQQCRDTGVNEYIVSLVALGFDINKGHIYFQSENKELRNLAFEIGTKVNFSEISAIYGFQGDVKIAHMISVLVQNADILQPQLRDYDGPKPTVIPVGVDQDPHIRLTRDIASRMRMFQVEKRLDENNKTKRMDFRPTYLKKGVLETILKKLKEEGYSTEEHMFHIDISNVEEVRALERIVRDAEYEYGGYGFYLPAATYHRFVQGLTGGKMSSSVPESLIALTEPPKEAARKVKRAKTGGRVTVDEQKKLGGLPNECTIYELLMAHLIEDDDHIKEIFDECRSGKRLCKHCKTEAAELMFSFLKQHQEERERAVEALKEHEEYKKWFR